MRPIYVLAMLVSYILLLPACISCRLGTYGSGSEPAPGASASGDGLQRADTETHEAPIRLAPTE